MKTKKAAIIIYATAVISVIVIFASLLILRGGGKDITYTRVLMGTVVEITIMDGDKSAFDKAADDAFNEMKRLEGLFSSYNPRSEASSISKEAGVYMVKVSGETLEVIENAIKVSELSGGAFDPTIGVFGRLWGFSGESGVVPEKKDVERLLHLVDYREIKIDKEASKAGLGRDGMVLNLGGIAKGYIIKKAVDVLKKEGVERGIIHAGGDMAVFQKKRDKPFVIGIQHPREKRLLGEVYVYNGAISTSGDYERFFMKDGVRYHHILDPKTGFPADRSRSVTIIMDDATQADALSTAVFVMGPQTGMELVKKLHAEAVVVDPQGNVTVSNGFDGKIFK